MDLTETASASPESVQKDRQALPIYQHRERLVDAIDKSQVVIISGSTGCGKTTQVPQYIMDHCKSWGSNGNMVITQPRRIAAMSVARRSD